MSRVRARRSEGLSAAFILTGEDLKKLHKALVSFGDTVTYEVKCSDQLTRELDFKKVIEYENPPRRAIRSIKIHVTKQNEYDRSAVIDIGDEFLSTFHLSLDGPESEVEKLNSAIMDILAGMRPWYWWLSRFSFLLMLILIVGMTSGLSLVIGTVLLIRGVGETLRSDGLSTSTILEAVSKLVFGRVFTTDFNGICREISDSKAGTLPSQGGFETAS